LASRDLARASVRFEYEDVLKLGVPEMGLTLQDIADFIDYLCIRSRLVRIYFR
jgi:hypothetical protein